MNALLLAALLPGLAAAEAGLPVPSGKPVHDGRPAVLRARAPLDARDPLVLVHGLFGSDAELAPVESRLKGRYQVLSLEYSDFRRRPTQNARELALELARLRAAVPGAKTLRIVAHSMGGLVSRAALLELEAAGELSKWAKIKLTCVDTPWHGAKAPGWQMELPGALDEMRSGSELFETLKKPLPDNVEVELVFAQEESAALDYTEAPLSSLPEKIAGLLNADRAVEGEPRIMNFWRALVYSSKYPEFSAELRAEAETAPLSASRVARALLEHYPRFAGGHTTVLSNPDLLEHLAK